MRPTARLRRTLSAALLVGALVAAGCRGPVPAGQGPAAPPDASGAPQAPAAGKERLVIVQGQEPQGIDAHLHGSMLNTNPALHIMEPLIMRGDDLQPMPWLAESWEWEDALTLKFRLRPGVVFHDGSPLTAEDVRFTFERIMDPDTGSTHHTYINRDLIDRIEVHGDHQLTFHLAKPFAPLLQHFFQIGIASRQAVERLGPEGHARAPVGTGPYILKEWTPGVRILMTANPNWWRGPVAVPELEWRAVSEDATRVALLMSGQADLITALPPSALDQVQDNPAVAAKRTDSLRSVWIRFNTRRGPLADIRVREAVNLAVNVQQIIDQILQGNAQRLNTVIGPAVFGYDDGIDPIPHDPERARQLLREAGYGDGFTLNFSTREGRLVGELEVAEAVAAHLAAVGIQVNIERVTHERYLEMARTYNDYYDLFMSSNANNSADAHWNLGLNFSTAGRAIYWSDPELDRLIDQAVSTVDEAERLELYRQALALMRREWPVLFLYNQVDFYGVSADLDWEPRPDDFIYLAAPLDP